MNHCVQLDANVLQSDVHWYKHMCLCLPIKPISLLCYCMMVTTSWWGILLVLHKLLSLCLQQATQTHRRHHHSSKLLCGRFQSTLSPLPTFPITCRCTWLWAGIADFADCWGSSPSASRGTGSSPSSSTPSDLSVMGSRTCWSNTTSSAGTSDTLQLHWTGDRIKFHWNKPSRTARIVYSMCLGGKSYC